MTTVLYRKKAGHARVMDKSFTTRNELLIGSEGQKRLQASHVMVFGAGGVGASVIEALVRAGIGTLSVVDFDRVEVTNLNRQQIATTRTIGQLKVDAVRERALSINPKLELFTYPIFYKSSDDLSFEGVDIVVDAIDSVPSKLELMRACEKANVPLIMALGTGRKLDPTQLIVTSLYKTEMDPLAKKMRILAKKEGLRDIKVITSKEQPLPITLDPESERVVTGSMIFVPASAGLLIASVVVSDLLKPKVSSEFPASVIHKF